MPVVFAPPAPIRSLVNLNRQQNIGGGYADAYAAEAQARNSNAQLNAQLMARDRQFGDQQLQERDQFAARQQFSPRDEGLASTQMAEIQQRAELQKQLQQEDFNHSDKVRLDELNQAQNEILKQKSSGQITDEERDQMLLQLRTGDRGINVLKLREQATRTRYEAQHADQVQKATQVALDAEARKGKQEEARLAYSAAELGGKLNYVPDRAETERLTAEYAKEFPDMPPEQIAAAVKAELLSAGKFQTWYPDKSGVPTLAKEMHGAGAGAEGDGGAKGRAKGIPEFDPSKAYGDAENAVDKLVTAGTIKPEDAQAEIEKRVNARRSFHETYSGEKAAEKRAGKAAPFDPKNVETGTDLQKGKVVALQEALSAIPKDLPPEVQFKASKAINEAIRLTAKWSDEKGRMDSAPPIVKSRLAEIEKTLLEARRQSVAPAARGPETRDQMLARMAQEATQAKAASDEEGVARRAVPPPSPEIRGLIPDAKRLMNRSGQYLNNQVPTKEDLRRATPAPLLRLGDYLRTY